MKLEYRFHDVDPADNVGRIVCIDRSIPADGNELQVVGTLEFGYPANSRQRMYRLVLGWLRVVPDWKRQGIATEVMRRFLEWSDGRSIYAEYTVDGAAFMRAYQKAHGKIAGLRGGWER